MLLDISPAKKAYAFYFPIEEENDDVKKDKYFCKCGEVFEVEREEDEEKDIKVFQDHVATDEEDEEIQKALETARISVKSNIKCPNCNTDYQKPVNQRKLKSIDYYFVSGYRFIEEDNGDLYLYQCKVKAIKNNDLTLDFEEIKRYLLVNVENNKLFFKDFEDLYDTEIDLNNINEILDSYFYNDNNVILNLFDVHRFINEVSKYLYDSQYVNVLEDILSETQANISEANEETFKKTLIIFFSMFKYSSLSTIALTKGPLFLYETLRECNPPSSEELKEAKVTSPLEIFNYLARNYIQKINEEVNEEKKDRKEFVFKTKQVHEEDDNENLEVKEGQEEKEMKINFSQNKDYKEGKVIKDQEGKLDVFTIDDSERGGKISKFVYNKLKKFHDYEQLMKYLKHITYNQLIDLLKKYDYDLIINMVDLIYHRTITPKEGENYEDAFFKEIKRLIPLFEDYVRGGYKYQQDRASDIMDKIKQEQELEQKDENNTKELNYEQLKNFDFTYYDDCRKILLTMGFDLNRHFYKIKTNRELKEFHDKVVKYYSAIEKEENTNYKKYFDRFRFLENREEGGYEGPLEFEILDTPTKVVQEGHELHHSGPAYVDRVLEGKYLMLRVFDHSENLSEKELTRFTLGLFFNEKEGLEFDQVKSYNNQLGSNRFRKLLMEWMDTKEVFYDSLKPDIRIR